MIGLYPVTTERFTLDTNILVYSVDSEAGPRHEAAVEIVTRAALAADCRLTLQSVSEFFAATTRKRLVGTKEAAAVAVEWLELFPSMPSTPSAMRTALHLSIGGQASYWAALLVASAAEGGCTTIITEDLPDGTFLAGVRILNPFCSRGLSHAAREFLSAASP